MVPLVLTPRYDLDPATEARLLDAEKRINELERVIDLEAIFSNGKELGRPGCAGKPNLREDPQASAPQVEVSEARHPAGVMKISQAEFRLLALLGRDALLTHL